MGRQAAIVLVLRCMIEPFLQQQNERGALQGPLLTPAMKKKRTSRHTMAAVVSVGAAPVGQGPR